jgi:hypothetical protein
MIPIYDIYYERKNGDVVFCGSLESLLEAIEEINILGAEFPEHHYWYEVTYAEP